MKINKEFFIFMKSTVTVLVTSSLIATAVWMFSGSFIATFLLALGIQYILFGFFGNMVNNYYNQITKQKELEKLEQLSTILECAYCKKGNVITFVPDENERIEFTCTDCNKKNVVNINFTVARITEPLVSSQTVTVPNTPPPVQ